jgi:hypothetical protein
LRCVNLAAQSNRSTVKDRMAGYKAFSGANAFPEIIIGNVDQAAGDIGQIKNFKDEANYKPNNLSPNFFKPYDLDAALPEDTTFTCRIWNHNSKPLPHKLIGTNVVDIEDRYWSQEKNIDRASEAGLMADITIKEKSNTTKAGEGNALKKQKKDVESYFQRKSQGTTPVQPIEYLPLMDNSADVSKTKVGTVECLLEVLTLKDSRTTPRAKFTETAIQDYEIRLVIWQVDNVPLMGKETMSLMCSASVDMEGGLDSKKVEKKTDIHLDARDGHGEFNYRMVFPMKCPCAFPRLKMMVYDQRTFGADESIGEVFFLYENPKLGVDQI